MLAWPCNLSPMFCWTESAIKFVKSFRAAFESTDFVGFFLLGKKIVFRCASLICFADVAFWTFGSKMY